ncbi:MAG: type II secretion system secretin GspD [Gammaproteobacteria bacterium]|nr:type II secretion system secretin GspD [Gammaproteobacteria bacterium]
MTVSRYKKRSLRELFAAAVIVAVCSLSSPIWAEPVTFNLKEADITAVASTVAEITGKNFVIDPRVKGKVTIISSRPMERNEIYQIFLSVLQVHGFAAIETGNVVKIVPSANAKQIAVPLASSKKPGRLDELVTRVIELNNVPAAQLVPILRPLVPQQGHLVAYPPSNSLVISDHASNIERLYAIIRRIDKPSVDEIDIVNLRNASATEVVRILNSLQQGGPGAGNQAVLSAQPTLVADERTNSILISGEPTARLRLLAVISHLDTPLESGGNTHVIYLHYADALEIREVLAGVSETIREEQEGGNASAAAPSSPISIQADEATNALVITAPPEQFLALQDVIRKLDIRRAQVQIEAVIAEVSSQTAAALGVQWQSTQNTSGRGVFGGTSFSGGLVPSIGSVAADPALANSGGGLALGFFDGTTDVLGTEILNLGVLVNLINNDTSSNLLATPNLLTLDNEEAEIIVGQNVPFITGTQQTTGGLANPFQTIERQDVGLTLRVTPQINEGDSVKLDIFQETSSISNSATAATDIITNTRSITTSVLVEDGSIVVLGGLIDDQLSESVQKIPVLGDIPVLGNLFRFRQSVVNRTNTMVFLRPLIIRNDEHARYVAGGKYDFIRGKQQAIRERGVALLDDALSPLLPEFEDYLELPPPFEKTNAVSSQNSGDPAVEIPPPLEFVIEPNDLVLDSSKG